jgi:DNA-directed RNA polymerase specialized sigma24 family protein
MAHLPTLQRELLRLRYRKGLRFSDIASILENPERTVRTLLVRNVQQLRTMYDQRERGDHEQRV